MSLPIWTPDALQSEAVPTDARWWRVVEAQHRVSTMKLVDTVEEQSLLEDILEGSKRRFPPECVGLDFLLATPFRYGSAYPKGSRFRRAGFTEGVYYAAETVPTALAEMAFYRLLFYAESPDTPMPENPAEYTAFSAAIASPHAIDLTREPLARDEAIWTHPTDYEPCQALADTARQADIAAILYRSVRDPRQGRNIALLTPLGFKTKRPLERMSIRIRLSKKGIQALCDQPLGRIGFTLDDFAADPRIDALTRTR